MPTRIEFELTEDIAVEGTTLFVLTEPAMKIGRRSTRLLLVLCGLVANCAYIGLWAVEGITDVVAVVGVVFMGIFLFSLWPTEAKARQMAIAGLRSRVATDPAYGRALGCRVFELRSDGFHVEAEHVRGDVPWTAVVRTIRTPDWFLIVFVGPSPVPVARESFPTDREFDDFADEAERLIRAGGGTVGASSE